MSIICKICEQQCPLFGDGELTCDEEAGHKLPHRAIIIGSREGDPLDHICIEWRPTSEKEKVDYNLESKES